MQTILALQIKFSISHPESTSILYRLNKKEIISNAVKQKIALHKVHSFVCTICENAIKNDPSTPPSKPVSESFIQKYFPKTAKTLFFREKKLIEGDADLSGFTLLELKKLAPYQKTF